MPTMFDLERRVPLEADPVTSVETARGFDRTARISMYFPMDRMVSLLAERCRRATTVVNPGCQTGLLALMMGGRFPNLSIYGIDDNEFFTEVALENLVLANMAKSPARVDYQQARLDHLPIDDGFADIVTSFMPLHRTPNPEGLLGECARICKPDGLVFLYDLARDAEEGAVSFVLQYINAGQDEFMRSLQASYTSREVADLLERVGLAHWHVAKESLNIRISSNGDV